MVLGLTGIGLRMIAVIGVLMSVARAQESGTTADRLRFRDGAELLGRVVETPARSREVRFLARREWVRENCPDRFEAWQEEEADRLVLARRTYRARLKNWQAERRRGGTDANDPSDPIAAWINAELERLGDDGPIDAELMTFVFPKHQVDEIIRADDPPGPDLLVLGWLAGFSEVEAMTASELRSALRNRNLLPIDEDVEPGADRDSDSPLPDLSPLLPVPETDERTWYLRRAATEVLLEDGLRFIRHQGMILPEDAQGGQVMPTLDITQVSRMFRSILGNAPMADPLADQLSAVARRGRRGAVVTELDIAADLGRVRVTSTLYVSIGDHGWVSAGRRHAAVNAAEVADDAAEVLGENPQVESAIGLVEALGLGRIDPRMKRRALGIGAATQKALGQVRSLAGDDLQRLNLVE